jgi:hypothetical protein
MAKPAVNISALDRDIEVLVGTVISLRVAQKSEFFFRKFVVGWLLDLLVSCLVILSVS